VFPARFRVTPASILEDTIPVEERLARTPRGYTIKGLFFHAFVRALGRRWSELESKLIAPAPRGDYVAFDDYPQFDHALLAVEVARMQHPDVPLREGLRRLERDAARVFAESTVGRVVVSLATDPRTAFRIFPGAYRHMQTGGTVRAIERPRGVRLEMRSFAPWVDCSFLGAIEGAVVLFGKRPQLDVELLAEGDANFELEWV
jgi:uncharacterized protein (TIGR02265 family)